MHLSQRIFKLMDNWASWCFLGENRNLLMCQKAMEHTRQTELRKHLGSFLEQHT
uniref:Uncharacterized protein n=1 Tax=Arundo donax TaxID=35708 RepID=A0A0A9AXM7_ARUDO